MRNHIEVKHRYFNDIYAEVDYNKEGEMQTLLIARLSHEGKPIGTFQAFALDFNTNKYLLDLAIEVDEDGHEGSDLW